MGVDGGDDMVGVGHKTIEGSNSGSSKGSLGRMEAGESEDEGHGEESEGGQVDTQGQEGEGQGDNKILEQGHEG